MRSVPPPPPLCPPLLLPPSCDVVDGRTAAGSRGTDEQQRGLEDNSLYSCENTLFVRFLTYHIGVNIKRKASVGEHGNLF